MTRNTKQRVITPQMVEELSREARYSICQEPINPLTNAQAEYINSIDNNILTFGVGSAGTGKTFIAAAKAAEYFLAGDVKRIIVTRPAVEAGEELGFLPGDLSEKFEPWFAPLRIELTKRLGSGQVDGLLKSNRIVLLPLAHMRGHTFDDAFVILDEAQNTTPKQMFLFLSRVGNDSKVVIDGDLAQQDTVGPSGLADAISRLERRPNVGVVKFTINDIVRSGICREILEAYAD